MDYKQSILSNKDIFMSGLREVSRAVASTMGPNGSTVIIARYINGLPKLTKDGVTVAKSAWFENPEKNLAAQLLRQAAEQTVEKAGDGTTTAIVLVNSILHDGGFSTKKLKEILTEIDIIGDKALALLDEEAIPLTDEKIEAIASISANDSAIGKLVSDAIKFSTNIKITESSDTIDRIENIDGMVIKTGIFDNAFINIEKDQSISYDEALFILSPREIRDYKEVTHALQNAEKMGLPCIIMAPHFSEVSLLQFRDLYNRNILKIGLLKTPGFAEHRQNLIKDIKDSICYETLHDNVHGDMFQGKIVNFKATKESVILSLGKDNNNNLKIVNKTKGLLEALKGADGYTKELLQQRIDMLDSSLSVIHVGGHSELEIKEKYDRIEDAVLATKCALEEGYIAGAGKVLYDIGNKLSEEHPIAAALKAPLNTLIANGIDFKEDVSKEFLIEQGIIDPVKVTKTALINALSVAKGIISLRYIIL